MNRTTRIRWAAITGLTLLGVVVSLAKRPDDAPQPPMGAAAQLEGCDPRPPVVMRLSAAPTAPRQYSLEVLASVPGPIRIDLLEPSTLRFSDGSRSESLNLAAEAEPTRRQLHAGSGSHDRVVVRLSALLPNGDVWLCVDEQILLHERTVSPAPLERRAVLLPLPNGRRAVEYMTLAQAKQRGLEWAPLGSPSAGPAPTNPDSNGGGR